MIHVTCTVIVHALDGKAASNAAIELRSHATEIDRVVLVLGGHEYDVIAEDLLDATMRASGLDQR